MKCGFAIGAVKKLCRTGGKLITDGLSVPYLARIARDTTVSSITCRRVTSGRETLAKNECCSTFLHTHRPVGVDRRPQLTPATTTATVHSREAQLTVDTAQHVTTVHSQRVHSDTVPKMAMKTVAAQLRAKLRLPAFGAPLFIVSNPDLCVAQCKSGVVGSFPALNARGSDDALHTLHAKSAW